MHIMEYYSALKGKEILTQATTWMNLEDIMFSKVSQSQKTNTVLFHLHGLLRVVKIIDRK